MHHLIELTLDVLTRHALKPTVSKRLFCYELLERHPQCQKKHTGVSTAEQSTRAISAVSN